MNIKIIAILIIILLMILQMGIFPQDISNGKKLMRNERRAEAKKFFMNYLNTELKHEAYFYLGEIHFIEGNTDSSKHYYTSGILADKSYPLNYAGLTKISIVKNDTDGAEKNRLKALEQGDEENLQVYITLSEAYSGSTVKKYDQSIELLNDAIKLNPKNGEVYTALGKVYLYKGDGTKAINNFQKALEINPADVEALTEKAKVYILVNNNEDAIALLKKAIQNDSTYSPAYRELAELYAEQNDYPEAAEYYLSYISASEATAEKLKRYASILYLNKEYQKAIETLKTLDNVQGESTSSIRIMAYSYLRMDDFDKSIGLFQKLFEIDSAEYLPSDYENYADLLTRTGEDSLAIIYLEKVFETDSTRQDVLGELSVLHFKNKNWSEVISTLEKKKTVTAQELFDLGKAYYFAKDTSLADRTFSRLIEAKPNLAIAYHWRARINSMRDPESEQGLAKPFYEQFVSLGENEPEKYHNELVEAYSYLGYYFYIKGDNVSSKENWQKVAAMEPENVKAQTALKALK